MKRNILTVAAIFVAGVLLAQTEAEKDTLWKVNGVTSLNFSQLSLSNWAAGGDNSLAGNALLKLSADFQDTVHQWDNDLTLGFGLIKQGSDPTRKSDDQIGLSSKYGYRASGKWFYSALLSFRTQFAEGFDNPGQDDRKVISDFMSPGYLNISAGMDYKPCDHFSVFISPLAGKMTFVMDDTLSAAGSFGVEPGKSLRGEFGGYVKIAFKKELLKNVLLDTKVDLFTNYLENPDKVDVNWDMLINFKVNEYISASLITQLIYDYDIKFGPDADEARVQFKELFGIGLTYTF
jgi:hypothetical protein